jgi:uncharacterized protein
MLDTPGVFIREIPSGSRPIAGVATSNTAFVGTFARGPMDTATRVTSFGAFERVFGGLHALSDTSYAVRSFFLNGGSVAFIVRVGAGGAPATTATATVDDLTVTAANAGDAGNRIRIGIAHSGAGTDVTILVREYDSTLTTVLNEETYDPASITSADPNFVDTGLATSTLVTGTLTAANLPTRSQVGGNPATNLAELQAATEAELTALTGGTETPPSAATGTVGNLTLNASSAGAWGNQLRIGVAPGSSSTTFTILAREYDSGLGTVLREESFIDVSITSGNARFVDDVLAETSELLTGTMGTPAVPTPTNIGGNPATELNDLQQGTAAEFAALTGGTNGTMEGDAGWALAASNAIRGSEAADPPTGIYALNTIVPQVFNLMCLPGAANFSDHPTSAAIYQEAYTYCTNNFAFLLVDPAPDVRRTSSNIFGTGSYTETLGAAAGPNSAIYYPRVTGPDPLNPLIPRTIGPSGMAAGLMARTDGTRGVWKAPAGTEARVSGGTPLDVMTDRQQGPLNINGVNVVRTFPVYYSVIWGARTMDGADARSSEWKYINVRRLALYIENSLQRGLQWVVFEPNDEPLWANVRMNVGAFMNQLFRQGAFQGASAREAYLVKCDSETTTQADINLGILNVYVGFAPVRPAEFVIIRIQQRFPNAA